MILFLLLLIVAGALVALYAAQNTATHDVTIWQWHWSAVPDWVPVVITAAVIGGLFLLYMIYSGMVHGVRVGSMRRRVSTREAAINDMRTENQRLREENARVRSELRGMDRGVAATRDETRREPVTASEAADSPRAATPFRPRPTFGERVRAFFSGREPAGY
ncbi:MAG: hypothetical protein E6I99_09465 [Chloroflexi bacterium]|nr:MAG: hypothetical protein E6I99_09465 [Chloroflexota bacterium]TMD84418.1 MAG: hypothetical protein E6I74_02830 [Chloroflexota bacterium]